MKTQVKKIITSLTIAAVTLPSSTVIFAQDSTSNMLEEVIVTAQKRQQSAQDLGISITSISSEALQEQRVNSGEDLAKVIPNVSVQNISGGGLPVVIVRGIGLQNFRINDSPTTSFYIDEVYQTSIASAEFSMFDLERVEVLKGPQGGLYGRNTIGGAIQMVSKRPEIDEASNGFFTLGFGRYTRIEGEGGVSMPISDIAAARVSARFVQSDDIYFRSTTGGFDYGEQDKWSVRGLLRIEPSDTVSLDFKVHGGSDQSELPLLRTVGIYKNFGDAGGFGAPGVSLGLLGGLLGFPGFGLCDSILAGNGSDPSSCATLTGITPEQYGLGDRKRDRYDAAGDRSFLPTIDNQWFGASMIATFDFEDYALVSITAYDEIDYNRTTDADGTPVEFQDIVYGTDINSWQQEFRLSYHGSDTLSWLIGVNYAKDELDESTLLLGAGGVLPLFFGGATFSPQVYAQETSALAIYGHAEQRLSDTWNLIAELRYTSTDKSFVGGQQFGFADGSTAPFLFTDDQISFDAFSGKIAMEWALSDNAMVYGSISRGFKTGGFFGGFATSVVQLQPFDEETILAYELGFKSDWLENQLRLNGSIFLYDREDVQMTASQAEGSVVSIGRLQNIGDVEAKGAELDITWLATDNLLLQLGLGYTDSEVVDSDFVITSVLPLIGSASLEGTNTPNYSKYSANFVGRYEREVGENLMASLQLEYAYRSERDLSVITNPFLEDPLFKEPGFGLINLRATLGAYDKHWSTTAFVENLANETYRVEMRSDGLFGMRELWGPERIWGLSMNYRWD